MWKIATIQFKGRDYMVGWDGEYGDRKLLWAEVRCTHNLRAMQRNFTSHTWRGLKKNGPKFKALQAHLNR